MSKSRDLKRFFFAFANEVIVDKQGRIVIPANLRESAGLSKEAMIIGASSHIEIWDKQRWEDTSSKVTSQSIAKAMDSLDF